MNNRNHEHKEESPLTPQQPIAQANPLLQQIVYGGAKPTALGGQTAPPLRLKPEQPSHRAKNEKE